ncbi:MAG: hypothetical protein MJE77_01910 [Proteobacteria bacterium]|nr:hypothetical protein [Pseudomonadota bacterium]
MSNCTLLSGFVAALLGYGSACSYIQFEKGPYVIRDSFVVYSAQEDVTFFAWQLRGDARNSAVSFELWQDGEYVAIDLQETAFAAAPYKCESSRWCYQYQVPGRHEIPQTVAPIRSVHDHEGVYRGPAALSFDTGETFSIRPIGLERNTAIDATRTDWFAENKVPMQRDFEWQITDFTAGDCSAVAPESWQTLGQRIELDHTWTQDDDGKCLAVRPRHRDSHGTIIYRRFLPSAETAWESQSYAPGREDSPNVYGILLDLEIPNAERCDQVKQWLSSNLDSELGKRGEVDFLGVYTRVSATTGQPLSGCEQAPFADYPVVQMVRDSLAVQTRYAPQPVRILWVYVNNIDAPPSDRIQTQIQQLLAAPDQEDGLNTYSWAIGSNSVLALAPWDATTGWRALSDRTFLADIRSFAQRTLPFVTMDHRADTEVSISAPEGRNPRFFKVCHATPWPIDAVGISPGSPPEYDRSSPHAPWPTGNLPFYTISPPEQFLLPAAEYVPRRVEIVLEVCERFCDNRFRDLQGNDHESWKNPTGSSAMEACQWQLQPQ